MTDFISPPSWYVPIQYLICLFDLSLYVPSTIFQLNRDGSSWDETVLSLDKCVLLMDHNAVTLVRLAPMTPQSGVKHFTTEPLRSNPVPKPTLTSPKLTLCSRCHIPAATVALKFGVIGMLVTDFISPPPGYVPTQYLNQH